ncbi:class 1 fructose-bisphosphatase [Dyadobacter psychrotolerans]|uniref:Fructose-1,6-bisphosphatase class 1 n=1 Tax=Dyadobacter psychrotolerans TaxID=2541721 RepID=A0A4R5DRI2_9BACT|nr:class 1 fructose-bisphosphatase [Dyadobacter psychrotolerans]TDE13675.1 class 1 fructose-bisphosphatase [Dyadobacter psychrotolerans]
MSSKTAQELALPVGVTLDRFIMLSQSAFPYATGELSQLLRDIGLAGKIINREINRAGLVDIAGGNGTENVQGENQQKLDIVANIRFIRALKNGGEVCAILSEEDEDIIHTGNDHGKYIVAMDPLDGSSNIDVNVSIGTIFSIYRRVTPIGSAATMEDFLQGGRKQIAAGYILYGSSTMLVFSTGDDVNGFTLDQSLGEFILSHKSIYSPKNGTIFSVNEGNYYSYLPAVQKYLDDCKRKGFSARYIGSLVGDFHRNLLKGGIYLYPSTKKDPKGKLRLLYECYPLAFLAEKSGGKASDGFGPILDIVPTSFHQRSPIYVGSETMVDEVLKP